MNKVVIAILAVLIFFAGVLGIRRSRVAPTTASPAAPLRLASQEVGERFTVSVVTQKTCDLGDLDAIELAFQYATDRRLIFSWEELSANPRIAPEKKEVELKDFNAGFRHTFNVPKGDLEMGLFLCGDAGRIGKCAGKEAIHATAIVVKDTEGAREGRYRSPDRIYAFQRLGVRGTQVTWPLEGVFPGDLITPELGRFSFAFKDSAFELALTRRSPECK